MKSTVKSIQLITNRFSSQPDPNGTPCGLSSNRWGVSAMTSEGMPMVQIDDYRQSMFLRHLPGADLIPPALLVVADFKKA